MWTLLVVASLLLFCFYACLGALQALAESVGRRRAARRSH